MSVRLGDAEGPLAVLKLYDRRGSKDLRKREQAGFRSPEEEEDYLWNSKNEEGYVEFVESGDAAKYQKRIFDEGIQPENTAEMETLLHDYCEEFFAAETSFYSRIEPLQGREVPRLMATVSYEIQRTENPEYQHLLSVPGIIMELIDGFPLFEIPSHIDKEHWQTVVDSAVSTIDKMGAMYGVLNKAISAKENIKVRTVQGDDGRTSYQVFFYDFAFSSTRDDFDTETEWLEAKQCQDERGAVGWVMREELDRWQPGYYQFSYVDVSDGQFYARIRSSLKDADEDSLTSPI
ncbi:hypothetical protein VTN00DRAFT_6545 [Thermoascus crustaceus]|uniref:uncharacterized protein n=1 Tax=Thermoascus crustaceus TaxID=5088 RepID=UPI003741F191